MKHIGICLAAATLWVAGAAQGGTVCRINTVLGSAEIELYNSETPLTTANFLNYVEDEDYTNMFFHRNAWITPDPPAQPYPFVVQGGGFTAQPDSEEPGWFPEFVQPDPPVQNEFQISNTRGTIAMAKLGGDPNSATNQWFVNMSDNSANLDTQNGGFTVFAHVIGDGMDLFDLISTKGPFDFSSGDPDSVFKAVPLRDYTLQDYYDYVVVRLEHLITVTSIVPLGDCNADGNVDGDDVTTFAASYGQSVSGTTWKSGDFDEDGDVDLGDLGVLGYHYTGPAASPPSGSVGDLGILGANYNGSYGRAWPVPEPTTTVLVGLAAVGLLRRRR